MSTDIKDTKSAVFSDEQEAAVQRSPSITALQAPSSARPPIEYTSWGAFQRSVWRRFASLWTRRFIFCLVAGQLVSLCITCTNVTTTELVDRNWSLPTTQTFFLYFTLLVIYTPYTMYKYGFKGWCSLLLRDGWKSAVDVEGNYTVVKAYQYTDLLSCMLLDAWAIPVCLFLSWVYMRPKYHWTQILGVLVCIGGLGMLVSSDFLTDKNYPALARAKGDGFMILGATFYGISNSTEEFFVRRRPLYEVIGQMGFWGTLINGIQAAGLEHEAMKMATWDGATIGILIAYTAAMVILYTVAPMIYRMASSAFYNISLLTSDFYGLLFGLFLFHYSPFWLYFPAFVVVVVGLFIYFWSATPEEQGKLDPHRPIYLQNRPQLDSDDILAPSLEREASAGLV